jgi:hypothetical protein
MLLTSCQSAYPPIRKHFDHPRHLTRLKPIRDVQAIWPGIQKDALLRNVITAAGGGPHEWYLLPFYCCHPAGNLVNQTRVYLGDLITNTYVWDIPHNKWLDNWALKPGEEGSKAGLSTFHGGFTFDQATAMKEQGGVAKPYDHPLLAIELQGIGTWGFGPVMWRNILIEANTTEPDWCAKIKTPDSMHLQMTPSVASTEGTVTSCYIARINFIAPIKKTPRRRLRLA